MCTGSDDEEYGKGLVRVVAGREKGRLEAESKGGLVGPVEVGLEHTAVEEQEGVEDCKVRVRATRPAQVRGELGIAGHDGYALWW